MKGIIFIQGTLYKIFLSCICKKHSSFFFLSLLGSYSCFCSMQLLLWSPFRPDYHHHLDPVVTIWLHLYVLILVPHLLCDISSLALKLLLPNAIITEVTGFLPFVLTYYFFLIKPRSPLV